MLPQSLELKFELGLATATALSITKHSVTQTLSINVIFYAYIHISRAVISIYYDHRENMFYIYTDKDLFFAPPPILIFRITI